MFQKMKKKKKKKGKERQRIKLVRNYPELVLLYTWLLG